MGGLAQFLSGVNFRVTIQKYCKKDGESMTLQASLPCRRSPVLSWFVWRGAQRLKSTGLAGHEASVGGGVVPAMSLPGVV
ncbi:hypothetical protein Cagg_1092 [Chloroflexus aggregans DSM 9485]|uniref:Uncharacterized protein n=1 Tax=Chloroflexus aggregans (strain MD-66 / DSM 9485) TaxID=326427 RepID=B8G748_CHLAD|nr:hypothetical protein Cagg_1092 [Chloroflexus aggregans DSM 9485]